MPRVYFASLTDYNAGTLHGVWVDIDGLTTVDEIHEQINDMLSKSPEAAAFPQGGPAEEWEIHDHEEWGGLDPTAFNLSDLPTLAGMLDEWDAKVIECGMDHTSGGLEDAHKWIEENYQGTFLSIEDWAENRLDEMGDLRDVPESLRPYIDFASWARDAEMGGDITTVDVGGEVAVFWNH